MPQHGGAPGQRRRETLAAHGRTRHRRAPARLHLRDLRDLALAAAQGGVGYYRSSDFVHIDTGRFRTWNG